ncbi:PREDICTED: leukemia inhibitory factor [Nipponia nippon]|nr:PREDICTED: leukemia inhibitory factor [Nipponia nippon]
MGQAIAAAKPEHHVHAAWPGPPRGPGHPTATGPAESKILRPSHVAPQSHSFLAVCRCLLGCPALPPAPPPESVVESIAATRRGPGSGCPGHGLCRSNVQEQTRRQVALLNATAQDLFSLYLKCQGEPFSSETDKLCNPSGVFFPAFRVNRTSERKEVMVAMYKLFAFLNASLGNITRDQEELNPTAKELLDRLHNTTKTTRGLISNLTCLLCKNYNVFQVDVSYGESSKGKSAFKKKQQGCQVLRKYVQVIAQAARVLLPHLSPL